MERLFDCHWLLGAWVIFFPPEVFAEFHLVGDSIVLPPFFIGASRTLMTIAKRLVACRLGQAEPIPPLDRARREIPKPRKAAWQRLLVG